MAKNPKSNKKKIIVFSALGVVLVLVVVAIVVGGNKEEIIKVQTEKVNRMTITQVVEATGKIQPRNQVKINAEVSGELIDLPVEEGESVSKAQLLLRIKPDTYLATRDQSAANVNRAKAFLVQRKAEFNKINSQYERQKELFNKGLISEADLETIKSNYEMAKANVDAATFDVQNSRANLSRSVEELNKTTVYSPIDGVITQLISKTGERVSGSSFTQGTQIMTVSDLSIMEARVEVNENDVVLINIGDTARIEVDAYPDSTFIATVYQIANTATTKGLGTQEEVTNFEVRLLILTDRVEFRPGMSCSARIETETRHNVLAVPLQCVTTREEGRFSSDVDEDDGSEEESGDIGRAKIEGMDDQNNEKKKPDEVVFVVEDKLARKYVVKTGISSDSYIEVIEGLEEGVSVVKGPYRAISRQLDDSTQVRLDRSRGRKKSIR